MAHERRAPSHRAVVEWCSVSTFIAVANRSVVMGSEGRATYRRRDTATRVQETSASPASGSARQFRRGTGITESDTVSVSTDGDTDIAAFAPSPHTV